MSDVKRYEPFGRDGLSCVMHEDDVGDYVRFDDYEAKREGWIAQHGRDSVELGRLCKERDQLRAELAAIRGQEPVAWMDEDGALHTTTESAHFRGAPVTPLYALPPQQPDAVSVPSDTALRRAAKFLAGIDNGCNEVKTLRALVANAQEDAVSVPRELEVLKKDAERWRFVREKQTFIWLVQDWIPFDAEFTDVEAAVESVMQEVALSTRQAEEDEQCAK